MKPTSKSDKLGKKKKFAKNDTSYSSFWLYNKDNDILSDDFKDKIVLKDEKIFSEFNPAVAKNIISFWSEEDDYILDPFAGRVRGFISQAMKRYYTGFEIVEDYYEYLNQHDYMQYEYPPQFINDDCKNVDKYINMKYDLLFTCPPYWNIEKYDSCDGQLSNINDYKMFCMELFLRLKNNIEYIKKDGYICIVIGDFRRNKKYYSLHSDLMELMKQDKSIRLHDVIAIQNIPFHSAAFYFGSKKKHKYTAKAHEYLLVYKKL